MPTTTPGALVAAKDLASAAARAARVAGGNGVSAASAARIGSSRAARNESARTVFDTQGDISRARLFLSTGVGAMPELSYIHRGQFTQPGFHSARARARPSSARDR